MALDEDRARTACLFAEFQGDKYWGLVLGSAMGDWHYDCEIDACALGLMRNDFRLVQRQATFTRMKNRSLGMRVLRPKLDAISFSVSIEIILDGEETSYNVVVERVGTFNLNRGDVMKSWAEETDDLSLQMAVFLTQGGASTVNFSARVEETLSNNALKAAIHRKLEEFEDGSKVG